MEEIVPFDLQRLFIGDAPPLFYLEIAFRTGVIWLWTMLLLRWIGGRSVSQMSMVEFLLVIALGSSVGDSMFQADLPLFHAMLVIFLVVLFDKGVDLAFRHSATVKRLVDGTPTEVVRDGYLVRQGLDARGLGPAEVMELLRLRGITNLGEVEHAFLEPSGEVSTFRYAAPRPGLRIVPPLELRDPAPPPPGAAACCATCGHPAPAGTAAPCAECGKDRFTALETART